MRCVLLRVYVRFLRDFTLPFFLALLTVFLEGFFDFGNGLVRYTFFGALSGVPNRLFCFADTFLDKSFRTSSVPTLQVPHCASVDEILPSQYVCVILVNTRRIIIVFNDSNRLSDGRDCEKIEFFLLHLGVSSVVVLVIVCVSDVFIVTLVVYVLLLVFLLFTGLYCTIYDV